MGFQSLIKVGSAEACIDDGQDDEDNCNDIKGGHGLSHWKKVLDLWSMIHTYEFE